MLSQPTSRDVLHRHIRRAWGRYVLPALLDRDTDGLLAALVIADTSLDEVLRSDEFAGETAGERLLNARSAFSNYADLVAARQTRNKVVHNLDYRLCLPAAGVALAAYHRALWERGVCLRDGESEALS